MRVRRAQHGTTNEGWPLTSGNTMAPCVIIGERAAELLRYVRHPNYLGEMMIYGSFALMVWHWLPFVVLAWVWGGLFTVNISLKEASMSHYPEWEQYKRHTWLLLPLVV